MGEPEAAETVTAEVEASTVEEPKAAEREAAALVTEARIEEVVNRIFAKGFTAAIAGTAEISRPLADGGEDDAEDASMARVAEADTKATADDEVAAGYEAEQTMQDWPASYLEPAAQGNANEQAMQDWPASFFDFDALDDETPGAHGMSSMQIGSIAPAGREDRGETGSVSGESSNGDSIASSPEEYYADTEDSA